MKELNTDKDKNRRIADAAKRAIAEAQQRADKKTAAPRPPRELGGRNGPEPTRFGDWEKKGITSDF